MNVTNFTTTIMPSTVTTQAATTIAETTTAVTQATQTMLASATTTATAATTTMAKTCFDFSTKACVKMIYRYNELAESSNAAGAACAVASAALVVFAISQFVMGTLEGCCGESKGKVHMLIGAISLMGAVGCAVGAGIAIKYDNQEILDGCMK